MTTYPCTSEKILYSANRMTCIGRQLSLFGIWQVVQIVLVSAQLEGQAKRCFPLRLIGTIVDTMVTWDSVAEQYRPLGIKVIVISLTGSNRRPVMGNNETPADEFIERYAA